MQPTDFLCAAFQISKQKTMSWSRPARRKVMAWKEADWQQFLWEPVAVELRSNVVYKFTCASCNSCYVGETSRHLSTRIREHLNRDRTSHIFEHLQQSVACRNSCSAECFEVIDRATTKFQVKIKEALHISWEQPALNKQLYHVNLTLSL